MSQLRGSGEETIVLFNEGLAYIGLGNIKPGEKLAESRHRRGGGQGDNLLDAQGATCASTAKRSSMRDI